MHNEERICSETLCNCTLETRAILESAMDFGQPWHVLYVRSNYERLVTQHLAARAIEHYLPIYRERAKWTDRTVVAERPLFPGYVFVRYLPRTSLTVLTVPGVICSLGDEERCLVSCEEVEKIREGLEDGLLLRPHPQVAVGARVRVNQGVFAGTEGVVTEFRKRCKVIMTFAAMRQCLSLEVNEDEIDILAGLPPRPPLCSTRDKAQIQCLTRNIPV